MRSSPFAKSVYRSAARLNLTIKLLNCGISGPSGKIESEIFLTSVLTMPFTALLDHIYAINIYSDTINLCFVYKMILNIV